VVFVVRQMIHRFMLCGLKLVIHSEVIKDVGCNRPICFKASMCTT
jgi:hypothetical protein